MEPCGDFQGPSLVTNSTYRIYFNLGILDRGHEVLSAHLLPFLVWIMIQGQFRTRNCCSREYWREGFFESDDKKFYHTQTNSPPSNNGDDRAINLFSGKNFLFSHRNMQANSNTTKQGHRKGISFVGFPRVCRTLSKTSCLHRRAPTCSPRVSRSE